LFTIPENVTVYPVVAPKFKREPLPEILPEKVEVALLPVPPEPILANPLPVIIIGVDQN
jgi:hypothetical protein